MSRGKQAFCQGIDSADIIAVYKISIKRSGVDTAIAEDNRRILAEFADDIVIITDCIQNQPINLFFL